MADFTLPSNPSDGDTFVFEGKVFVFSGGKWSASKINLLGDIPASYTIPVPDAVLNQETVTFNVNGVTQFVNYDANQAVRASIVTENMQDFGVQLFSSNSTIQITSTESNLSDAKVTLRLDNGRQVTEKVINVATSYNAYLYANVDSANPNQSINIGGVYGFDFALGGTRMFVAQRGFDFGLNWGIVQYNLSTPWDLTTATVAKTLNRVRNLPKNLTSVESGEYIAIGNYNVSYDSYMFYRLTTPGEIDSTVVHARRTLTNFTGGNTQAFHDCATFSNNGSHLYLSDSSRDQVYHYELSTPFDVDSFTLNDQFGFSNPNNVTLDRENGNHVYVDSVQYSLTTPFDLSTRQTTSTGNYFPGFVRVQNDGAFFFTADSTGNIQRFIV